MVWSALRCLLQNRAAKMFSPKTRCISCLTRKVMHVDVG